MLVKNLYTLWRQANDELNDIHHPNHYNSDRRVVFYELCIRIAQQLPKDCSIDMLVGLKAHFLSSSKFGSEEIARAFELLINLKRKGQF